MQLDILDATYSTQDTAFALQHGNFGDFRRNLSRMTGDSGRLPLFQVLPRHAVSGAGGGEYRYGHIVEFALHMHLGAAFTREIAKWVIVSGFRRLKDNDTGLAKFNGLSAEDQQVVWHGRTFTQGEDWYGLSWFVDFPHLVLGADIVSRDENDPMFWVFNPASARATFDELILAKGTDSLLEAHRALIKLETAGAMNEMTRQLVVDRCHVLGLVNITSILNRLDFLLSIRLRPRKPIGA